MGRTPDSGLLEQQPMIDAWAIVPRATPNVKRPFFWFMNGRAGDAAASIMNSTFYSDPRKVGKMAGHPVAAVKRRVRPSELH